MGKRKFTAEYKAGLVIEMLREERAAEAEKAAMLKTIGQLTLERDFLMEEVRKKEYKVYLGRDR